MKAAILSIFREQKEAKLTEVKEGMMTMSYQTENINKMIENTTKNHKETLELKSTVTEMKNSVQWLRRFELETY